MSKQSILWTVLIGGLAAGCAAPGPGDEAIAEEELGSAGKVNRPVQLQAGTNLITYGVTDDDWVLFQDGGTLYASTLRRNTPRRTVAQVGTNQPTVLISGRVALIWTEQFYFGAGGVSPLVVWTADAGPKLATAASTVSTLGTRGAAVRPDSREIVFVANASAGGTVGDIVRATPDLRHVETLVAGVDVDVNGACLPLVGYDGKARPARGGSDDLDSHDGSDRHIIAAYCPAGAGAATLSRWDDGRRRDLAGGLALQPTWSSDARGEQIFTIVGASQTPVLVSASGKQTVLENTPTAQGFINFDGDVLTGAFPASGGEIHRFGRRSSTPETVAAFGSGPIRLQHHAEGFRQYTDIPTSADARLLMYSTAFDPSFGFDMNLLDLSQSPPRSIHLADPGSTTPYELFTTDSSHALYYVFDPTTGNPTLFAASPAGDNRAVSSGDANEFENFSMTGTLVAYSDHMIGTGIDLFDRHDIQLADVGAGEIAPVTLAAGAYNLFFPTPDRRSLVYTSDAGPETGLFLLRVR